MSEMKTFSEWRKGQPRRHHPKKTPVKNPYIDAFVKSVDDLKRDMDTLDATEKKTKDKKPEKEKPFDRFKDYENRRDSEDKKGRDHEAKDDQNHADAVSDELDDNQPGEPVRRLPGHEVSVRPQILRKKSRRPNNPGIDPMAG